METQRHIHEEAQYYHFFNKPDVCYYGGDGPDKIVVCEPLGKATVTGTSFAAP